MRDETLHDEAWRMDTRIESPIRWEERAISAHFAVNGSTQAAPRSDIPSKFSTPNFTISASVESFSKRALDLVGATSLLFALTPLLLLVALIIALEGRGSVFFTQRRTGLGGKTFRIIKFRTMTVSEDGSDIVQARRGDARVTRVGRFLRSTSIDELPQLLNVLKGDMSLVGPRPHAFSHDATFAARVPQYRQRFRARPGITGLAQVRGQRGEIQDDKTLRDRISSDLEYIDGWTLLSDIEILFKSCRLVFMSHGY